jgi:hypothetical protein
MERLQKKIVDTNERSNKLLARIEAKISGPLVAGNS